MQERELSFIETLHGMPNSRWVLHVPRTRVPKTQRLVDMLFGQLISGVREVTIVAANSENLMEIHRRLSVMCSENTALKHYEYQVAKQDTRITYTRRTDNI